MSRSNALTAPTRRATWTLALGIASAMALVVPATAVAQTGVDDDRVSLPEGPGSLEGVGDNVEIDPNMGSMRTTVPVTLPEGFGSLMPDLTLSYSSAAGSGAVGIGWSLPEMSIERMTARQVPLYDTDDFFAANGGDELVQVAIDGSNLVYRARFEKEFTRYTWVAPGAGADGYWKAQFADGTTGYFGADRNGTLVDSARSTHPTAGTFRYLLVDHVDPYGHAIRYEYTKDVGDDLNNRPLLERVSWLEDVDGSPIYSAELSYEARTDHLSDAGAGFEELLTRRLTGITVRNGNETIREYVLTYEEAAGGLSRLVKAEQYGLGGQAAGQRYPVVFSFGYQKGLGIECEDTDEDCGATPYMFDMGNVAGGGSLTSGKATLIDINGDGLADVLDTSQGTHHFYLNKLVPNDQGGFDHFYAASPLTTALNTSLVLTNASDTVQVLDLNGDGFSDLVDTVSGSFLLNDPEGSDWSSPGSTDVSALTGLDFTTAKFFDYDNDKRIDVLLTVDSASAKVYENQADGFVTRDVAGVGTVMPADGVQMADVNGDGLNDIVRVTREGIVDRNLNLGRGVWTGFEPLPGVTGIDEDEHSVLDLEDLNGDGLNDLLVVGQGVIKYKINRAGRSFESLTVGSDWTTITSAEIDGTIPDRTNKTVLYADMNANGSEDIVWFDTSGNVQYLELFPSRPNLLSRIDNGLGFVQKITYGTSAEHAARAEAAGTPWRTRLPHPNAVVDRTDIFVTLTGDEAGGGLHEIRTYSYRNGWYDGVEKQFRGFADVTVELQEDPGGTQEGGRIISEYDLGQTVAGDPTSGPHRNGLQLSEIVESGGDVLAEKVIEYSNCDVAQVPPPAELTAKGRKGVYHPCQTAEQTVLKERLTSEADWRTVRSEMDYDGYGQVTLAGELGDIDLDGDEDYTRTTYYEPTGEFWMLGLVAREEHSASDSFPAADTNLTLNYYDGPDFEGLDEGQATHGFLTRTERATAPGEFIQELRQRRDEHGNSIETIDPNGTVDGTDHRRTYTYDDTGKFLVQTDLHVSGDYQLRRESRFEYNFQKVVEATQWMLVEGGEVKTARNSTTLRYDDFGRLVERFNPGDTDTASQRITWELGEPFSRAILEERTDSAFDRQTVQCYDGKGRVYQTRTRIADGTWQVDGFTEFNASGEAVKIYQPFTVEDANGGECSNAPPAATVRAATTTLDALGRTLTQTAPGEEIYGETLLQQTVYLPLAVETWDFEDTADGPHKDTPTRILMDGLDRAVAVERLLSDGTVGRTELLYDGTNSFAGYVDAQGNRHELTVDLADRVVAATDPNTGTTAFSYDAAGNLVAMTDARGVTVETVYDGQNRLSERFDPANREGSLVSWHYDTLPEGCELTECTNVAGQLAMVSYPVDLGGGRVESGSDRFGYDLRQRQIFAARRFGLLADLAVQHTFNNQDEIVSTTYPGGTVVDYTFDGAGRPTAIGGFVERIEYDPRSEWTALDYANGARLERTLDALQREASRRITTPAGTVVLDHTLTLNRLDKVTAIDAMDDLVGTADTLRAELDAWYRPTAVTLDSENLSFGYDVLDRILSLSSDTTGSPMDHGELSYSGEQPLAVTSVGALSLGYDAAGMMTGRGNATFERDELGRLIGISRNGESWAQMTYGADDRVVQRTEDGTLVLYGFDDFEVRDGVARVYGRVEGDYVGRTETTALMASIYPDATGDGELTAGDAFVARVQGDEAMPTAHVLAAAASRLLTEQETATTALHTDYLGHVVAATDEGGEVRGRRGFYPFGLERYGDGHVDVHGFTGQEHDVATGMIHMRYRELDPVTGRWDRFDPSFVRLDADAATGKPGEATTGYAYMANGPFNGADPSGLEGEDAKTLARQLSQKQNMLKQKKTQKNQSEKKDYDLKRDLQTAQQTGSDLKERITGKQKQVEVSGGSNNSQEQGSLNKLKDDKLLNDVKIMSLNEEIQSNQKELSNIVETMQDLSNEISSLETRIQQLMSTPSLEVEINHNVSTQTDNKNNRSWFSFGLFKKKN